MELWTPQEERWLEENSDVIDSGNLTDIGTRILRDNEIGSSTMMKILLLTAYVVNPKSIEVVVTKSKITGIEKVALAIKHGQDLKFWVCEQSSRPGLLSYLIYSLNIPHHIASQILRSASDPEVPYVYEMD